MATAAPEWHDIYMYKTNLIDIVGNRKNRPVNFVPLIEFLSRNLNLKKK